MIINFIGNIPKIKKLAFFFLINIKQYKKNVLLFYIMLSLIFGGIFIKKKKENQGLHIFNIIIKKKKIYYYLLSFVNIYLPLLSVIENYLKKGFLFSWNKHNNFLLYRLNYFSFPVISELDLIYLDYEMIYNFINSYKFQLDIYIKIKLFIKDVGNFLFRFYRFPCILE